MFVWMGNFLLAFLLYILLFDFLINFLSSLFSISNVGSESVKLSDWISQTSDHQRLIAI